MLWFFPLSWGLAAGGAWLNYQRDDTGRPLPPDERCIARVSDGRLLLCRARIDVWNTLPVERWSPNEPLFPEWYCEGGASTGSELEYLSRCRDPALDPFVVSRIGGPLPRDIERLRSLWRQLNAKEEAQ